MPSDKIFPRNLTARAAYQVPGNPDISRPEDSVSNCFPGLDWDIRTLDRRFFPGLVFEYVFEPERAGAMLLYSDPRAEPDLRPEYTAGLDELGSDWSWIEPLRADLFKQLTGELERNLAQGVWHLDSIEQDGRRIELSSARSDGSRQWLPGQVVWRLVRGLDCGEVTVRLLRRATGDYVELKGWRRLFTDPQTGVLDLAYQPGELQMSLCSPWQHDFRDCACHYWSSNRPDVVHGEVNRGLGQQESERKQPLLDWMRADRSPAGAARALTTMMANRPFQMDHLQINHTWQKLNIVIGNAEIGAIHQPEEASSAEPYDSVRELFADLRDRLAPLEMTLALEYLYARFSIAAAAGTRWPDLVRHAEFIQNTLLRTAVGEMQHLRAANELMWRLAAKFPELKYKPVLRPLLKGVPGRDRKKPRDAELRAFTAETLEDFIAAELPSGTINGAYARVVATLKKREYGTLGEFAGRIVYDGLEHHARFREVRSVVHLYGNASPYLRPMRKGTPAEAREALKAYRAIVRHLTDAYERLAADAHDQAALSLSQSRAAMDALVKEGDRLASQNIGIPFW